MSTTEQIKEIRKYLSELDYGHDYLVTPDLNLIYSMLSQELPLKAIAACIAVRRHREDEESHRSRIG